MLGWVDTLLQGVLLGGLYSLYATGLSVIFGIMRLVNLAHGDLIVLGAFLTLALSALGVPLVVALVIVSPLMFAAGYALQSNRRRLQKWKPHFTPNSWVTFKGSYAPSCSWAVTRLTVNVAVSSFTGEALTFQYT